MALVHLSGATGGEDDIELGVDDRHRVGPIVRDGPRPDIVLGRAPNARPRLRLDVEIVRQNAQAGAWSGQHAWQSRRKSRRRVRDLPFERNAATDDITQWPASGCPAVWHSRSACCSETRACSWRTPRPNARPRGYRGQSIRSLKSSKNWSCLKYFRRHRRPATAIRFASSGWDR